MNIWNSWICNKPIAHRGLHNETDCENSFPAFENAINKNFAIEIDIRPTKDGEIVVFHDDNLSRLTGVNKKVEDCCYREIESLKLLNSNERIPKFNEVLNFVNGKVPLLIEIKNSKLKFIDTVFSMLKTYKGEFAIQSFNPFYIKWFRKNAPNILRGQLASFFKSENMNPFKKFILKRMLFNGQSKPDFISYKIEDLPNKYVGKNKNKPCLAWVVKSKEQCVNANKVCDNIIFEDFVPY